MLHSLIVMDICHYQKLVQCSHLENANSMTTFPGSFGCEMIEQCVSLVVMSIPSLFLVSSLCDFMFNVAILHHFLLFGHVI